MTIGRGILKAFRVLPKSSTYQRSTRSLWQSTSLKADNAPEAVSATAKVNFSTPYEAIYTNEPVHTIILPGLVGEYGITADHTPVISELKAGVVQIMKKEGDAPEKYFISGGFAATHLDNSTDVSVAESFKLSELDLETATQLMNDTKAKVDALADGESEKALLQVEYETYETIVFHLGSA